MGNEHAPQDGLYIYGIINDNGDQEFGPIGIGGRQDRVCCVRFADIAAVVSATPKKEYEPRRANMIAHQKVLEAVMAAHTVLPVRFSTVSPGADEGKVVRILEEDYPRLKKLLVMMEGKKEMGLKVMADEAKIYASIISRHDDIRIMRDKLINLSPEKTHYQRVKIGEMVAETLKKEMQVYREAILDALTPIAEEVKVNDNYGDMMVLNAAFLIRSAREPEFDAAVNLLDERYHDMMTFKYVGTLPPYNFVNISITVHRS
jgi:hypothetical protein